MASRRTKSIGTKVTPEEYARIQTLAGEQPVSEWVRAALLKAADPLAGDATPPHSSPCRTPWVIHVFGLFSSYALSCFKRDYHYPVPDGGCRYTKLP
jgi:hypothetical protein